MICIACHVELAPVLARHGSLHCHECRDSSFLRPLAAPVVAPLRRTFPSGHKSERRTRHEGEVAA